MEVSNWVNIATKAYQQALEYESVDEKQRKELFHFIHDWFLTVEEENRSREDEEQTPSELYEEFMRKLKESDQ